MSFRTALDRPLSGRLFTVPRQTSRFAAKHSQRSKAARSPFRLCRFSQIDRPSTTLAGGSGREQGRTNRYDPYNRNGCVCLNGGSSKPN